MIVFAATGLEISEHAQVHKYFALTALFKESPTVLAAARRNVYRNTIRFGSEAPLGAKPICRPLKRAKS
jgi:hypothetical protein